ncbi:hypothetical protein R4P64_01885 [Rhodococcus sp. IEGM 1366]|uniref:hypothetical protein n=1 Tax=Rhodococcus sp. IEGM 1366 TaxID=3082223 RepID=UPI002953B173|nr:hypothetical protein [Rhodococcus sp. IEGM 1366]MDV8065247.1 hypothetical protein [Rhodococcus sp. IEGM 1366]
MQIRAFDHYALSSVPQIVDQAEGSDGARRQSRTDCTSINMRYIPPGSKTRAVQRNTLYNTMIHPDNTTDSVTTNGLRVPTTSGRLRARALEIVCTLYRCTTDEAADLLVRHSQTNNLKVTSLIKALVALIDEDTSGTGYGSNNALASHFWLREIRNLSQAHRRSDHFHRHLVGA